MDKEYLDKIFKEYNELYYEIPEIQENARERQYIQGLENKQLAINEVRQLYAGGHSIDEISRLTGHTTVTIKK